MARRSKRPVQLHLELQWPYLNWLSVSSEDPEFYEKASLALLGDRKRIVGKGQFWPEAKRMVNH